MIVKTDCETNGSFYSTTLDIASKLTAWSSVTILDLAGCSAKLGVEIGMGAAGTAIGAFQAAAELLGGLGGCVGIGGKCNLEYPNRPCFYKALSNRPKGASKQSSQYSYSTCASPEIPILLIQEMARM